MRDLTQSFTGERISRAKGNAKIDKKRLVGQRIVALRTWGKHFLIELDGFLGPHSLDVRPLVH